MPGVVTYEDGAASSSGVDTESDEEALAYALEDLGRSSIRLSAWGDSQSTDFGLLATICRELSSSAGRVARIADELDEADKDT